MFEIDLQKYRVVDLSYEVIPCDTGDRPFAIKRGLLADRAFKHDIRTHTHVGTHVEVPAHFYEDGKDVTAFPLEAFMGRAILLEVHEAGAHPGLSVEEVDKDIGGLIREDDIVLCRNNDRESRRLGEHDKTGLPFIGPSVAEWLRDHKIKMLGIDNFVRLSADIESGRRLHDILMSHDINLIEFLDNLDALRKKEFYFMALPFKARQVDSAWARAIAIEER